MDILKFIKKIMFLLPILFVIIGFNYFVDPANIFRGEKYYEKIVGYLLEGKNVGNMTNYDERLLQREYIKGLSERREIAVLGSSRSLQIASSAFPGHSFLNNSVSGATIEDNMAIYWMYRKKDFIPSVVVIGLDPWLLNKYNYQGRYRSIVREYQEITKYIIGQNDGSKVSHYYQTKYFELISLSYFQSSFWHLVKSLREGKKERSHFYPTSKNVSIEQMKLTDGTISYDINYRNVSPSEARLSAVQYAKKDPVYSLGNFTRLDPNLTEKFDKFIDLLNKDKVKVVFFLPPYHPAAYNILAKSDKYKIIKEAQKYFEKYAKDKKIKLIGSYNPNDCYLGELDFYDGMHIKRESINRLFKSNRL